MNGDVNLNWTAHTQDIFSNGPESFIQRHGGCSKKYNLLQSYQTNISLWGILGKNVWYFDIFSLPPPLAIKAKTADLELPTAAAL